MIKIKKNSNVANASFNIIMPVLKSHILINQILQI